MRLDKLTIKTREALASALAVDEVQLIVERVRGNGGHAGRDPACGAGGHDRSHRGRRMITVWGEGRGFRVIWLLEEMGLPYRIRDVDLLAGVENDPEFLAFNPGGFIPALQMFFYKVSGTQTGPFEANTGLKFVTPETVAPYLTKSRYEGTTSSAVVV